MSTNFLKDKGYILYLRLKQLVDMKKRAPKAKNAFTLVEVLVTTSILVIISTAILFSFPKFNSKIAFDNLAYQIALKVREAQIFGLGVRGFETPGGTVFSSHGISFDVSTPENRITFSRFVDLPLGEGLPGDRLYNAANEEFERLDIRGGNSIFELCGHLSGGQINCTLKFVNILFERPDPDAIFRSNIPGHVYGQVDIIIIDRNGELTKTIQVFSTGQISIQ